MNIEIQLAVNSLINIVKIVIYTRNVALLFQTWNMGRGCILIMTVVIFPTSDAS